MTINLVYQILCLIGLISGLIVVSSMNPIHRIAYQVIVFLVGAFILTLLDYYFQGLTYIIVYVGAIAILFQFVIMMVQIPLVSSKQSITTPKILINNNMKYSILDFDKKSYISVNNNLNQESSKNIKKLVLLHYNTYNINNSINVLNKSLINNKNMQSLLTSMDFNFNDKINDKINNFNLKSIVNLQSNNIEFNSIIFKILNNIFTMLSLTILLITLYIIYNILPFNNFYNTYEIVSYFYPIWAIEYKTMTDIESLGNLVYIAYPTALILIGIALWIVLIGIISLCTPNKK